MSRIGTQFRCAVYLSLLISAPFYCLEESAFDIDSDGIDTSDEIDRERLMEMAPLLQPIPQKQSVINKKGEKKLILEHSKPTYRESKHTWETDIRTTLSGQKYPNPTYTEPKILEPTFPKNSLKTKSQNTKPKYPILFAILKKHLLRTANALSTKSSDLEDLVVELEERLSNTPTHFSMQSQIENKQTSHYSDRNDEEEERVKKATTKYALKLIKALLEEMYRPSTEDNPKMEELLDYATPTLIETAKRDVQLSSEQVKDDYMTKFNYLTKHPRRQKNINNDQFTYFNQMNRQGKRKVEKELKRNYEVSHEQLNYLSTENYSNTVVTLKFVKQELITTEITTIPLSAKEVKDLEIFKQNMTNIVINEYTSTNPNPNNSSEDENKIKQLRKSPYNILSQENMEMASPTPKKMRESWVFIAQDQIPSSQKDLQWWLEEVDELEVGNSSRKLSVDDKAENEFKTLNSNGKEKSAINFKRQSTKYTNNEITKIDDYH